MALENILFLTLVVSAFVIFALTLAYGDFQTSQLPKE
jgi:hypothetical protein